MELERESGDEEEEMVAGSSSNLREGSSFKDKVMGVLHQGDFLEKRVSKLTQVGILHLLSLFTEADIHF
jgi:hypothetical protein